MATHGVRGDVILKAPLGNPRAPTTAATGPVVAKELFTTRWSSRPIPFGISRTGDAVS